MGSRLPPHEDGLMEDASTILLPGGRLARRDDGPSPAPHSCRYNRLTLDLGTSFELLDEAVIVGRCGDGVLRLDDPSVSRHHARIEPEDGRARHRGFAEH